MISIFAPAGIPEIQPGDNLATIILQQCQLEQSDIVVVTSKIVSKAENRIVTLDPNDAQAFEKLILSQSRRILRRRGELLITETHHGFICANAGIDRSNIEEGKAVLLPVDPDLSARIIREQIKARTGIEIGIIISDTFGRTWRRGVVDIALGCAGIGAILDLRGTTDNFGNILRATEVALADEIASAADLAKPKSKRTPIAIVRGIDPNYFRTSSVSAELIRPPSEDLFR